MTMTDALPPETLTAAAKDTYEAWQRARGVPAGTWDHLSDDARRGWETAVLAAAPHVEAAVRARVLLSLGEHSSRCSRGVHVPWDVIERVLAGGVMRDG